MHFSRNPPGPKTSCIEAFAFVVPLSEAGRDAADCLSRSLESSSTGAYLRSTVFIAWFAFSAAASLLELLCFLTMSFPLPGPGEPPEQLRWHTLLLLSRPAHPGRCFGWSRVRGR